MGMIQETNTQFGVLVDYWHIGNLWYDKRAKNIRLTVYGYVSQEARLAGSTPLLTREYTLPTEGKGTTVIDPTSTVDGVLQSAYKILTMAMVATTETEYVLNGSPSVKTSEQPFSEFYGAKEV